MQRVTHWPDRTGTTAFVLVLIVLVFSLLKLDQVRFFERGHFLSPDSIINLFRSAVPIMILSGGFIFPHAMTDD